MSFDDEAISIRDLSKAYVIPTASSRPTRLAEAIHLRLAGKLRHGAVEQLWALRAVSFEVGQGDVVGIIGRNGAGKTTLLKIVSRITEPTLGEVRLRGRVGSLLEVGTGFHPELTGRENVYLNGAILGMKRHEIDRRFDSIVGFAEVEKFLDTPVKHYSSGMYMRLAFAVAAHLEAEILLVDEVLAVGDATFQSRCLDKMGEVSHAGRTVLFVSHNLAAIERLCTRAIILEKGALAFEGRPAEAISHYLNSTERATVEWTLTGSSPDDPHFRRIALATADGRTARSVGSSDEIGARLEFVLPRPVQNLLLAVAVTNELNTPLFSTTPMDCGVVMPIAPGTYSAHVFFPRGAFLPKRYHLICSLYSATESYHTVESGITFDVSERASSGSSALPHGRIGDLQIQCKWDGITAVPEGPVSTAAVHLSRDSGG